MTISLHHWKDIKAFHLSINSHHLNLFYRSPSSTRLRYTRYSSFRVLEIGRLSLHIS